MPKSAVTQKDNNMAEKDLAQSQTKANESVQPASAQSDQTSHADIAARAYQCWCERGCPEGSPEVDWHRAEADLRAEEAPGKPESQTAGAASA